MEPSVPQLRIEPWPDPVIDHLGFPSRSPYLETGSWEAWGLRPVGPGAF